MPLLRLLIHYRTLFSLIIIAGVVIYGETAMKTRKKGMTVPPGYYTTIKARVAGFMIPGPRPGDSSIPYETYGGEDVYSGIAFIQGSFIAGQP